MEEFLKVRTWIFAALYWIIIIWKTRCAGVKIGVGGVFLFGIVFLLLLLVTLAHPISGCFLAIGFVLLILGIFKDTIKD
jgi:hypothetical protein